MWKIRSGLFDPDDAAGAGWLQRIATGQSKCRDEEERTEPMLHRSKCVLSAKDGAVLGGMGRGDKRGLPQPSGAGRDRAQEESG